MIKLYHGAEARVHPVEAGTPILRRDVDNIVVRIHRDQAVALVAELMTVLASNYGEANIVIENADPFIRVREI